jgi:serine/threonine protein kinase
VFRAIDIETGQIVAVKVLSGGVAENEQAVARFRREVDIASAVRHPQVVQTYDVVTDPDTGLALVMELLSGPTLSEVVRDGGVLTATATARLGHALADAVAYLENRGLVRMDLKPSNVIMHPDRGPVIIDLGLARFTAREDTIITQVGAVVGTPTYMAPEQFESLPVDIRADIYAIGLLLYFSLVGNTPWEGEPMVAMAAQIVNSGLDVSTLPVSPEFRAVIARATAIDREQRFAHAADLRAALAALPDISAPPS